MVDSERTREQRARRALDRQGFRLVKTRRIDSRAIDYGTYQIHQAGQRGAAVTGKISLDTVEAWIDGTRP
jgi:hypothetical protein